jgi:hypothetical protein
MDDILPDLAGEVGGCYLGGDAGLRRPTPWRPLFGTVPPLRAHTTSRIRTRLDFWTYCSTTDSLPAMIGPCPNRYAVQ